MEREEVIKNLRACLISSKGGVKMEDLNSKFFFKIEIFIFIIILFYSIYIISYIYTHTHTYIYLI